MTSHIPAQKAGMDNPIWEMAEAAKPLACRRRSAAKDPSGTAMTNAKIMPRATSQAETPSFGRISPRTSRPPIMVVPKSPVRTPNSQST